LLKHFKCCPHTARTPSLITKNKIKTIIKSPL
jgi:hypothetical protein